MNDDDVKIARDTEAARRAALTIAADLASRRSVTIEIPRNHPKAPALLELAKRLARREKDAETGIVIEKFARHDADKVILGALRDFVDVDEILRDLNVQPEAKDFLEDPRVIGRILESALPLLASAKLESGRGEA